MFIISCQKYIFSILSFQSRNLLIILFLFGDKLVICGGDVSDLWLVSDTGIISLFFESIREVISSDIKSIFNFQIERCIFFDIIELIVKMKKIDSNEVENFKCSTN